MGHALTAYIVDNVIRDIRAKREIFPALCDEIYDATYHDLMRIPPIVISPSTPS